MMITLPQGKGVVILGSLGSLTIKNIQKAAYEDDAPIEELKMENLQKIITTIENGTSSTLFNITNLIEQSIIAGSFNELIGDLYNFYKIWDDKNKKLIEKGNVMK